MPVEDPVLVVGAGVSGLTAALVLANAGFDVEVVADEIPGRTSLAAGAMWGPYLVEPKTLVDLWSQRSLEIFRQLASESDTGVSIVSGIEASRHQDEAPGWTQSLPDYEPIHAASLPIGFLSGYRFRVPLIDMPIYLDHLQRRIRAAGVSMVKRHISTFDSLSPSRTVINCAGMGARTLAADTGLRPIRGQHVVVTNPGLTEFFSEDTGDSPDLLCIYPQGDVVVLGGTAVDGSADIDADPVASARIVERCASVEPRLADAKVLEHRIGLRPTRPEVRVAAEQVGDIRVIHNYGHGGAGVTLSWGCAERVLELLRESSDEPSGPARSTRTLR